MSFEGKRVAKGSNIRIDSSILANSRWNEAEARIDVADEIPYRAHSLKLPLDKKARCLSILSTRAALGYENQTTYHLISILDIFILREQPTASVFLKTHID